MIVKIYKSLIYSIKGLFYAYKNDTSFRLEVWAVIVPVGVGYLAWPLSPTEATLLVLSYFLVLITELLNTALEEIVDKLHPGHDAKIGAGKDIASGAVFLALILSLVIYISILFF